MLKIDGRIRGSCTKLQTDKGRKFNISPEIIRLIASSIIRPMRCVPDMGGSRNEYRILGGKLQGIFLGKCRRSCKSNVKVDLEKVR
jgi:hypothetical protein